jgi:hypothetical protein
LFREQLVRVDVEVEVGVEGVTQFLFDVCLVGGSSGRLEEGFDLVLDEFLDGVCCGLVCEVFLDELAKVFDVVVGELELD